MQIYEHSDAFWTDVCGVYRHDKSMAPRSDPRRYFCAFDWRFAKSVEFFSGANPFEVLKHREAVCDDFGNLVRVS